MVAPELERTHPFYDGLSPFRKDALLGYMHVDGTIAVAPRLTGGRHFHGGLAAVLVAPDTFRYIDKHGEFAFDGEFCEAGDFGENGLAAARIGKRDQAGYLNKQGGWAIAPRFVKALRFCADGAAPVSVGENQYGLIDPSGAWIVQPGYRFIDDFNAGGLAFFGHGESSWDYDTGFLDARGDRFFPGAPTGCNEMVDGVIRESDYYYVTRHGKFHVDGMDWGGEINEHGFALGRTAHEDQRIEGQPNPPATWGILDIEGEFVAVPANALEPLTDDGGMFEETETDTPLAVFFGDDDDLLMLDREARIAYRLRRESCAEGQYAALYDAEARLLWTSPVGAPIALPERFFVAPPHTLMDKLPSPDALIDFAKAMLLDTERKLQLFALEGQVDDENEGEDDEDDEDQDEDDDAAIARYLTSRSRIVRFYLNEELVGYYQFLAEERSALLQRIKEDCVARLSAQFGPPDNEPDFAGQPHNTWYYAWQLSLDTPLPGAGGAPEANRLWLALNWSGDTGDGDEWGDLWLTCAPSLATLELAIEAASSLDDDDDDDDDVLLRLVTGSPDGILALAEDQVTAALADAAALANAAALAHLPARYQTSARLEALIRKNVHSAYQIPAVCMSAEGLALTRSLYGRDKRWSRLDAQRSTPPERWDAHSLAGYWGALLDAAACERAVRAGAPLSSIPLWLRTPALDAIAGR
ncbi:hypothetical protein F2P45_17180 [Massilia sp. CCM 8733]|uniref:WG repeat-containing protein n=1 Tax=Massilia mucilaginosa TaxID=2609282 RepID=A0ABX0NV66_9BURK|nr:hypothetical protein [Massilia mucilaginosa]